LKNIVIKNSIKKELKISGELGHALHVVEKPSMCTFDLMEVIASFLYLL
jgi:hypothetical protein